MGTNSHIFLRVKNLEKLITYCKLYIHFDGHIDGVGAKLIKFLASKRLINGINFMRSKALEYMPPGLLTMEQRLESERKSRESANGIDCLYAQVVKHFKEDVGDVYLVDPTSEEEEEWNYYVDGNVDIEDPIKLTIKSDGFHFTGTVQEAYDKFVLKKDEGDSA